MKCEIHRKFSKVLNIVYLEKMLNYFNRKGVKFQQKVEKKYSGTLLL